MRRALVVASQRGCPGPSSMGPVLGGWRPMGTESGEAPPSGAGRGRGVSPDQAGASEAPGSGAGRGKVASGSLFSRILEKPKERPRKEPAQAAGGGAASRSGIPSVSSEIGPDGSKVYRLRADRPGRFADPEAPDNREEGMRGDARAGSRRSRLASEDFALDAVRPRRVAAQARSRIGSMPDLSWAIVRQYFVSFLGVTPASASTLRGGRRARCRDGPGANRLRLSQRRSWCGHHDALQTPQRCSPVLRRRAPPAHRQCLTRPGIAHSARAAG